MTGDTVSILPAGEIYKNEDNLKKVSLASVRSPRVGNERMNKPDEDYARECKERLRLLCAGKTVKVTINYERDIPLGETTERRQFGTISVGKREDVGEVLVSEGLAVTQHHRDDEEKSPRYDTLVATENNAKAAKKGMHSDKPYKSKSINDLTDPKKAKAYSGSLMRAGTIKAVVEYVFNGSRYKLFVPSENCHIIFALANLKSPQPSTPAYTSSAKTKPSEPFGDISKYHARLHVLQRTVQINCTGVTLGGVITGDLFVGEGPNKIDFSMEMVGNGLAVVDQRKIDYGEASRLLVEAHERAMKNKVGVWSLQEEKAKDTTTPTVKSKEENAVIKLSEIRSGNHFFFHVVGDEAFNVIDKSMRIFTDDHGLHGGPCDPRVGNVVAALFDDGSGKRWYRASVVERKAGLAKVLFVDYGNVASVPIATHLRPLDIQLGLDRIPAVAKEASLALTKTRGLDDEDGIDAARMLQRIAWGREMNAVIYCKDQGKLVVSLKDPASSTTLNEDMVTQGLARVSKPEETAILSTKMIDSASFEELAANLKAAESSARRSHRGMWRYGDVGDDDPDDF